MKDKRTYFALFGENELELLPILRWAIPKHLEIFIVMPGISRITILRRIPFINKCIENSVKEYKGSLGKYKGLWYPISQKAIDLTLQFYKENIKKKSKFIDYYNRLLHTKKFEAYIKKKLSFQVFTLLKDLHLVKLSSFKEKIILINGNPLNRFIVKHLEDKYKIRYKIVWLPPLHPFFYLALHYIHLVRKFIKRGITFNKRIKKYKVSREAVHNFYRRTLRDDLLIDNKRFKTSDILMLEMNPSDKHRRDAFQEAKKKGFDTVSVPKLRININKNIFNVVFFYLLTPLISYLKLLTERNLYLFYYATIFYSECFPIEVLMNQYRIKCHISTICYDDIATTIALNKYGAKNAIYHWNDLTFYKTCDHAFMAYDIYFVWGDIHYNYHSDTYFVDKKINIGCLYKTGYAQAVNEKEETKTALGLVQKRKTVVFFDTSFDDYSNFTEKFFLEFMDIIREFCERNENINVLLKPKGEQEVVKESLSKENCRQYEAIWRALSKRKNFTYLDIPQFEDAIAISDVCVGMGMTSPSTVALICGKDALYFNNIGNVYHPFAREYMDIIVFEKREPLFKQIESILEGRFNCKDIISEKVMREYDTFPDNKVIERLREELFKETTD